MKLFAITLCLVLSKTSAEYEYSTEIKTLTPEESSKASTDTRSPETESTFADRISRDVPPDNGGNYGDLIHRYRENKDRILLREVVISQALASGEQDIHWSASISGARISSVRALNIGRERAYCWRIDVAGGDVQVIMRVPPLYDPRVLIEVYGF